MIHITKSHNDQLTQVTMGETTVWFSYETPIAFQIGYGKLVICENVWSSTTGKHLNSIDGGSSKDKESRAIVAARTPRDIFRDRINAEVSTPTIP